MRWHSIFDQHDNENQLPPQNSLPKPTTNVSAPSLPSKRKTLGTYQKKKSRKRKKNRAKKKNSPDCVRTNRLPATTGPNGLLANRRARMRRIDHPAIAHEDAYVRHVAWVAVAVAPEQHVACLGLGAREVSPHAGMVLGVCGARDGFVEGGADGVLS